MSPQKRSFTKENRSVTEEADAIGASDPTVAEVAEYIGQISGEIANMARDAKLDMLAYFLTMARLEAEIAARHSRLKNELLDPDLAEWNAWPGQPKQR